jgi:putative chitinase
MNYSAQRLTEVWHKRFPTIASAVPYAHNPEKLANHVYANRNGNGDEASGDGWRFRGVGPLQNTGRSNMEKFAEAMGMSLDEAVAYAHTLEGGVMAAAWFWEENDINRLADTPGVTDETRKINGGEEGLADRAGRFNATVRALLKKGA